MIPPKKAEETMKEAEGIDKLEAPSKLKEAPKKIDKKDASSKKQELKKEQVGAKKTDNKLKKERKKFRKLANRPEPSQAVVRAVGSGFLGVLGVTAITYVFWGILTSDSILYAGAMIDYLSMGNTVNGMMGVWALSFTPLTSITVIIPNWAEIWYWTFIPLLLSGLLMALLCKRIKIALLGGAFFVFWGIVLPMLGVFILGVFGIADPAILDGVLIGILGEPMSSWNYDWLMPLFSNNIFISWSAAGAIELGLIVTGIAVLFTAPMQALSK